jgi:hypothetical protein
MICQFNERRSSFWSGCVTMGKGIEIQRMYSLCLRPASTAATWRNWAVLTSDHLSNVPFLRLALKYIVLYVNITWTQLYYMLNTVSTTCQFISVYSTDWMRSGRPCQSSAEDNKWIFMKLSIQRYSKISGFFWTCITLYMMLRSKFVNFLKIAYCIRNYCNTKMYVSNIKCRSYWDLVLLCEIIFLWLIFKELKNYFRLPSWSF